MIRYRFILPIVFSATMLGGCANTSPQSTMTPLQIQSMETRDYSSSKDVVFPSVISVFQDLGYTITNASKDTGLISAESATEGSSLATKILLGVSSSSQTKATAFIEKIGNKTRVRLNFVVIEQGSSQYGQNSRADHPILDAKIYQNAFEKIDSAIFVRKSSI
ncbi:MAG: hypothetical protein K0R12_1365 [Gammaproteobacteria bacterium]|jgi:hypothetical protein|nr:hypothetical protein [Gammaproteobacteria bacterium]